MSTLTQADLDAVYRRLIEGSPVTRSGRPKFVLVTSVKTSARIENACIRNPRRLARRKAHGGKNT